MSKFDTHGGYFAPKDYMRVNEGGSHEENPNGGVQIGVDPEGNPNLLEEGEPVYKDYVYSDNIEAEEQFLVDNNLPKKYAGKLYSKIADDLFSEAEERPLDPISRKGLEALLGRLADAQEGQKQAKDQADLEAELANLSPEELDQLEAMLSQGQQPEQMIPEETVGVSEPSGVPVMACGGVMKKYPDGGNLDPVYVTAKGPKNYNLWDMWLRRSLPNSGLRLSSHAINPAAFDLSGYEIPEDNILLDTARVTADAPRGYEFDSRVIGPQEKLVATQHPMKPWPSYPDADVSDDSGASTSDDESGASKLLPTWPRYAGAIGSGLLGLYNVFQQPDKYKAERIQPYTPEGRINFQNQVYNPIDQNMIANTQIAQANATNRALRNSGLGPSAAASILAADNNTTGNLGTGFIQAWDANNQRKNAVIAANNQSEAQRAQFDANIDYYRTMALRDAAVRNAQNDLMIQRLNNEAEAAKYNAISNQINSGLEALSGIGQENFAMNQINTNPYFIGYGTGPNGGIYYNPLTRRYEYPAAPKAEKETVTATPAGISPFIPLQYNVPQSRPTLFPGSESKYLTVKRKK